MDLTQIIAKYGNRRFVVEGTHNGQPYMVLDDTIMYIEAKDRYVAEGLPLADMQDYIHSVVSLPYN